MADKRQRPSARLIFQSREGGPLDPGGVVSRWFHPAVESAIEKATEDKDDAAVKVLTGLNFHDLRHTFGSLKISQGEDVVYVSKQLGHNRPSITFDVYAHLLKRQRPEAAKKTDELIFGKAAQAD